MILHLEGAQCVLGKIFDLTDSKMLYKSSIAGQWAKFEAEVKKETRVCTKTD